jgi:hypothetical protein
MATWLQSITAWLDGVSPSVFDDEPVGDPSTYWSHPQYGTKYRPLGHDFRIVREDGDLRLEVQTADGTWQKAEEYDHGYDDMGKLHAGHWRLLSGSRADSVGYYRKVGNGLTGKNVPPERLTVPLRTEVA